MSFPKIGNLAPNFSLLNQRGDTVALKTFKGKCKVVVYFYPKASTPGCTVQACGLRDYSAEFKVLNTVVLGVSPDSPAKLQKFDDKYELGFDLLSHSQSGLPTLAALLRPMGAEENATNLTPGFFDEQAHFLVHGGEFIFVKIFAGDAGLIGGHYNGVAGSA